MKDFIARLPWQVQVIGAALLLAVLYLLGYVGVVVVNAITSLVMEYRGLIAGILCFGFGLFVLAIALISGYIKK